MAVSEEVKSKWYEALFENYCHGIVGCPSQAFEGRMEVRAIPHERSEDRGEVRRQDGRGANGWAALLHVGASRGCVKLIMQLLRLRKLDDFDEIDKAYSRSLGLLEDFSFSRLENNSFQCEECEGELLKENQWRLTGEYDLCPDWYAKQGNQKEFTKIESGWRKPPVMGTISPTGI